MTFLFTDVEGSTRRWETDADAMREALADHDKVLRKVIEAHDGFLFKHTGDGVCAAFSLPKSAVDAAIAAQRALELPVRMGLATGEAEVRDGDYFGAVLNRAARVMAAGHGGQILVAESTAGLLGGVDLLDLGPRRLRDVPMPVGVSQVRAAGLRTEFPPLRALDTTPGNLRPPTTSLIGRESEVADIKAAVKSHRLVTLTGVGGVGKTRLAMDVAARLADEFPDGVWFFELAAVTDPAAVPDAVAAVLGVTQQPGKSVTESVAAAQEGRVRLLVIDNCEHVLGAAADLIEAILAQSSTARMLATSREVLGLAEEQVRLVRSLDSSSGIDAGAVRLFVERAEGTAPGFLLTNADDTAAVVEICQRVDGIPLAIELAASRMASMTVSEVRDRLDHRFRLLVGSRRGLARHHTLRHAVAWSYDLLDDTEKTVLERCSVFAGGFDLQGACAVAGSNEIDEYALLDVLDALVRKSLIVADRSLRRTRFSMLETIRQFAEEQLVARGEAGEIRTAHSRYFAGGEAEIMALWDSPLQREAYDWLTIELSNLRAAFRWAADQGDIDSAATIAAYAGFVGFLAENYEPITWAEEIVEPLRAVDHPRLGFVYVIASMCWTTGRIEAAARYADAGQMVVADDSSAVPFGIQSWLSTAYLVIGQPEQSVELCRTQIATGRDTHTLARTCLALALPWSATPHEAMVAATGLTEAAEATRNPYALCFALMAYGLVLRDADPDCARETLRRGLVIARDSGNRTIETHLTHSMALHEANSGDPLTALEYFVMGIRKLHDSGNTANTRGGLTALAALLERLGHFRPAAIIAGYACDPLTTGRWIPEINTAISHLRDVLGDPTYEALARKGEAMTTAEAVSYAYDQIDHARAELSAACK
ncbi:adenylate/guanylate cyclase domain-containing protein [Mycobacterium sp. 1274761.0]|uniref:adenylate/guanylate cyclase domain-containing protein n=1 Tax=Mycobacterium sp. 1274761.0 TaxID=1834077 RepID=UPI0007FDEA51|nr:adenylate/guanylate cyclase domain-containing protein [Mycobacterium sp. 1274761.0]OBK79323.1 cyclase [Mycobacterium sp. 1274761.0]